MRRPAGVVVAAIILGILALVGIFFSALILAVSFVVHTPLVPNLPAVRLVLVLTGACILVFWVFCAWTAVGLLRMRLWARYTIILVGALQFVVCAMLCAGTLLARSYAPPLPSMPTPVNLQVVLIAVGTFYALLSLVGVSWVIYFNLAEVRQAFQPSAIPVGAGASVAPRTRELPRLN